MLELKDLHGGYGKITILNGVSFSIPKGSITTVIGPNGAGKSTVFKAIFGLLNIHSGQILLDGKDVTRNTPRQMIANGVTYVPQGRNVVPQLSVYHNLELGVSHRLIHPRSAPASSRSWISFQCCGSLGIVKRLSCPAASKSSLRSPALFYSIRNLF